MIDSIFAEAFIASVLNDATLLGATALNGTFADKVFKNVRRQGSVLPVVVFNVQAPWDGNSGNGIRLWTRPVFQVRTIGRVVNGVLQDASRVRTAAHRADDLLKEIRRQSFTVESVTRYFNVWREDEIPPREEPGETADVTYRNYGGFYRVEQFT